MEPQQVQDTPALSQNRAIEGACNLSASLIQIIEDHSPNAKSDIEILLTEFINDLNHALYIFNQAVASIKNAENHAEIALHYTEILDEICKLQSVLHTDFKRMKNTLNATIIHLEKAMKEEREYTAPNDFTDAQSKRKNIHLIFGMYKLIFQTMLFENDGRSPMKSLMKGMDELSGVINRIQNDANVRMTMRELHSLVVHLSVVTKNAVLKLQNWLEINPGDATYVEKVKTISNILTKIYLKQMRLLIKDLTVAELKQQLLRIYRMYVYQVIQVSEVKYTENSGGEVFIRGIIFDGVAVIRGHTDNLHCVFFNEY